MIQAQGIYKSYGKLNVLKGVDVEIAQAEVVSIVGRSGAGKSTLLHILGTLDTPDQGKLIFDGIEVNKLSAKKLAAFRNQHIGFIFQFHHLLPEFTALENVCIPAFIQQKSQDAAQKKAKELLDYLGLSERMKHKPNQMSGGEQQRVVVARALINEPRIVFADEPTGNLDSNTSQELHNLIFKLRDDFKQSFVIVTHNEELAKISDRRLEMEDGKLL